MQHPVPPAKFRLLLIFAWLVTLLGSALPDVAWQMITGSPAPEWLFWLRMGLLTAGILACIGIKTIRSLWMLPLLLLLYQMGWWSVGQIRAIPAWANWEAQAGWGLGMVGIQALEIGIAIVLILVLFAARWKPHQLYLPCGEWRADAEPLPWLGMKHPTPWHIFGGIIMAAAFFGGIVFLFLLNPPSQKVFIAALPFIPAVIFISALNALGEELAFRSAMLAAFHRALGKPPALLLNAVFFGLAHYSGSFPDGLMWVLLTGFLGYLFGKAMLETKGLFMPWLLHTVADLPVLFFTAMVFVARSI